MSKVRFRTNALLKSIIGKDLITDDNIAVLELVKNSFDAGSKTVDIVFQNLLKNEDENLSKAPSAKNSKLIIKDTGVGMSEDDLKDKWLNIAYSEKKEKREEFGRVMAGNKGVGRFSCDRLGRFLTIYTRKKNKNYCKLAIDWSLFEVDPKINFNIQDVEFEIEHILEEDFTNKTGIQDFPKGTILEISCLREHWHFDKILSLKRQLERLINPNQAFKKNQFGVNIEARDFLNVEEGREDYNKVNGEVKNKIFEKLDFKTTSIHASIDSKGEYITTTLQDKGNEVFSLVEVNPFNDLSDIQITIFYLNTYAKAYFTRQTGVKSVDFGSIFLFINGFRIPPYGDDGDDWLGIEMRKGQGHSRYLGTREIVGRIEIFDENEKFKIISNRSGVVNNNAFEQLTKSDHPFGIYYKTFRRLERFVVEGIKWDSAPVDLATLERISTGKKWDESKEKYNEDALTKNKRILSVINNIIDAKRSDIIKLDVNDDFVKQIIEEQGLQVRAELENVLNTLKSKAQNIDQKVLDDVLSKLARSSDEINSFSKIISNYSDRNETEIKELDEIKESLALKYDEILKERSDLVARLKSQQDALEKARKEKDEAERELELEKEKNTYLRTSSRSLSEDAKGLVHNIKITSKKISTNVDNLYDKILNGKVRETEILRSLGNIKFQAEKALKISKLITRANFNTDKNEQVIDVVKYIIQYIEVYSDIYEKSQLEFDIKSNGATLMKKISVLDISLVLDDLISNAEKANAKKILMTIKNPKDDQVNIRFSDDGDGVAEQFLSNPDKIFELGVTTTDGSGIGLNSVRSALRSIKGTIEFKGNNVELKGACFDIIIN